MLNKQTYLKYKTIIFNGLQKQVSSRKFVYNSNQILILLFVIDQSIEAKMQVYCFYGFYIKRTY